MITIGSQVIAPLWGVTGTVVGFGVGRFYVEIAGTDEARCFWPEQLQLV